MAELTDEQVERGFKAYMSGPDSDVRANLRAAAPFLQIPWDEPNCEEVAIAYDKHKHVIPYDQGTKQMIEEFVRLRNAALLPKPIYPRRDAVIKVLSDRDKLGLDYTVVADEILEVLDKGGY